MDRIMLLSFRSKFLTVESVIAISLVIQENVGVQLNKYRLGTRMSVRFLDM